MLKSRKKLLLSSIAMLLVALVALGSATFAWYSVQTTVSAETTQFNASVASGLVIRHRSANLATTDANYQSGDATWTTALKATNNNALLTATSLPPRAITLYNSGTGIAYSAVKGASATATSRNNYAATTHTLISDLAADGGYLLDQMFVAGEGGTEMVDMSITGTTAKAGVYLNLAVYIDGNLEKVYTFDSNATTRDLAVSGSTASEGSSYSPTAFTGSAQEVKSNFQVDTKANGGTEIKIIAYVDGFNNNCTSETYDTSTLSVTYNFKIHGSGS